MSQTPIIRGIMQGDSPEEIIMLYASIHNLSSYASGEHLDEKYFFIDIPSDFIKGNVEQAMANLAQLSEMPLADALAHYEEQAEKEHQESLEIYERNVQHYHKRHRKLEAMMMKLIEWKAPDSLLSIKEDLIDDIRTKIASERSIDHKAFIKTKRSAHELMMEDFQRKEKTLKTARKALKEEKETCEARNRITMDLFKSLQNFKNRQALETELQTTESEFERLDDEVVNQRLYVDELEASIITKAAERDDKKEKFAEAKSLLEDWDAIQGEFLKKVKEESKDAFTRSIVKRKMIMRKNVEQSLESVETAFELIKEELHANRILRNREKKVLKRKTEERDVLIEELSRIRKELMTLDEEDKVPGSEDSDIVKLFKVEE